MRHTRLLAALLVPLALAAGLATARAADPTKKPDDFRGIRWGAAAKSIQGLTAVDRDGEIVHYDRPAEKKDLGGIPLHHVTYSFFKDQFYHAEIGYEGEGAFEALERSLEEKYGPPDAVRQKTDPSGRPYEVATWNWPGHAFIGNRHDKDGSGRGRIFYFYAPLTDASAKAQGLAPAPAQGSGPKPGQAAGTAGSYTVQKGDSLARIARQKGLTEDDLARANPGLTDKTLKAGATIALPAATRPEKSREPAAPARDAAPAPKPAAASGAVIEYTVKDGDILSKVANSHGARTRDVIAANPGINPDALRPGTVLRIPVSGQAAPKPAPSQPADSQPATPAEPEAPAPPPAPQ